MRTMGVRIPPVVPNKVIMMTKKMTIYFVVKEYVDSDEEQVEYVAGPYGDYFDALHVVGLERNKNPFSPTHTLTVVSSDFCVEL